VLIHRAGDVIPKITQVIVAKRTKGARRIKPPTKCPSCGTPLVRDEEEVVVRCSNPACPAQRKERIRHFASRLALDIEGLGDKLVELLIEQQLIATAADLFRLELQALAALPRLGAKSATNLLAAIDSAKETTLPRFLFALGIREVGEATAAALARHFGTLASIRRADIEALEQVDDVGPIVAQKIAEFFADPGSAALVDDLVSCGISWPDIEVVKAEAAVELPLAGQVWVLTGKLVKLTRSEAKAALVAQGAKVAGSVSAKTTQIVAGPGAGAKLAKAEQLEVSIMGEAQLLTLLASLGD